jgi:cold-inducible RNA-binding protein
MMLSQEEKNMAKKLYIGGLAYSVTDEQLRTLLTPYGTVESATVVMDRDTDRSRGFGFVEMGTQEQADKAIGALNGTQHEGRTLTVNMAKPREDRGGGGSRGGGGGGRGGRW